MNGEIVITEDVPAAFAIAVRQAFNERGGDQFSLALSGGSTATPCYEKLSKENLDWSKVDVFWGDERCVSLDHEDSNYLLAKRALFDHIDAPANIHPMTCADNGERKYEQLVAAALPLDFVHLGMGDDGHTASLFPDSPALEAPTDRLVVATGDDLHKHPRLTLTFSALAQSSTVVFTVVGAGKREMFDRIRNGEHLPAGRVAAERIIWLVDPAAAGQ